MGTGFFVGETFEEERFDFWRDGVFEAFGLIMGFGPRNADDLSEQHLGELMAEGHVFGYGAAFAGEVDVTIAGYGD